MPRRSALCKYVVRNGIPDLPGLVRLNGLVLPDFPPQSLAPNLQPPLMDPRTEFMLTQTRRQLLTQGIHAAGTAALASIMGRGLRAADGKSAEGNSPAGTAAVRKGGLPGVPHLPPKAKRIIYLFMNGGPSQMDMFDYKPATGRVVRQGSARRRCAWGSGSRR